MTKSEDELEEYLNSLEVEEERSPPKSKVMKVKSNDVLDEVDQLLNDPDLDMDFNSSSKPQKLSNNNIPVKKCAVVYIGSGFSPSSQRSCPKMRCSKCDCSVVSFNNFEWDTTIDYLFLRNNYPDFTRLKPMLKSKTDSLAYACQCSSISLIDQIPVNKAIFKWFCASH